MTKEEIVAYQAKMRRFWDTPLGASFRDFDNAHATALIADTNSGWMEGSGDRNADAAWKREKIAREALLERLFEIAGVH